MLSSLYFLINALEAAALAAFMLSVKSSKQERIFLDLSVSRLVIVVAIIGVALFFLFLAVRSLMAEKKQKALIEKFLVSETAIWLALVLSAALIFGALFMLTRPADSLGSSRLIVQRLEPILAWMAVFGTQTLFFVFSWYSAYFMDNGDHKNVAAVEKELLPLFGMFAGLVIIKLALVAANSFGPVGRGDEMTYYTMADSLYYDIFTPRDYNHYQYPPLYPLSLVVTLVFKGWAFEGVKLINVFLSSSIIIPTYFISKKFVDVKKSLLVAFLACLIPYHFVFPRRIVSENLFLPLFFWALFITFTVPANKRSRLIWDLANGLIIGLLYLTRYITLATIPFFMLAWWIKPFEGERSLYKPGFKKTLHALLMAAVIVATYSPWVVAGVQDGVAANLMLGFGVAAKTTAGQLTIQRLLMWAVLYAFYFILVAAPVFSLLIVSLRQMDFKNWRHGFTRWIIQTFLIMGGFYAAVTRHSWRAFYNREIPSAIMGRYLIVFSVVYFIIAVAALMRFKKTDFRSRKQFILAALVVPFLLVVLAYLTLIKGVIIPTDGDLIKSQGSADAFYIQTLGGFFLPLVFMIDAMTCYLMWKEKRKLAVTTLAAMLVVYYIAGLPSYFQDLLNYQTYPFLASRIARLAPQPDPKSGASESFTVFVPFEREPENDDEIFNGLYTRGFENTIVETYTDEAVAQMATRIGFIIKDAASTEEENPLVEPIQFNGREFLILPIEK